jgi:hydroxymethylpyrimidine pyrophosphatase-like HAD family hydrolase
MNDISMIEKAGLGVAVQNADEVLKVCADVVSPYTNDENAIEKIIKEYGYTEE